MLIEAPFLPEAAAEADEVPPLIGPNAILQLAHVMEERIGTARTMKVMRKAGLCALPSGEGMIPEADAIAMHHALALCEGDLAEQLVRESGERTADYIIANRIPKAAVWLLKRLPAPLAGRLLMIAIGKHAWTFTGAGRFTSTGAWAFSINRSEADDWNEPPASLFAWYEAVFERLFKQLTSPECLCHDECATGPVTRVHHYRIERVGSAV